MILEDEGYRVVEAEDGARALALLAAGLRPWLLLTDLRMPVLDGRGLLAAIARLPGAPTDMTIALVTGSDVTQDRQLRARCSEVLLKPVSAEQLLALAAAAASRSGRGEVGPTPV